MTTYIIGAAGSGKTVVLKKKVFELLADGKPVIYINFEKSSNDFSKFFKEGSLIINANSFTQISKIKDKEFNDLIFIDRTYSSGEISNKSRLNLLIEIFKNENWQNHTLLIDENYRLDSSQKALFSEIFKKRDIFMTLHSFYDMKGIKSDRNIYLKSDGRNGIEFTDEMKDFFKTKKPDEIKYIEEGKDKNLYKSIIYNPEYSEDREFYLMEIERILR